jgi:hypothetical protein
MEARVSECRLTVRCPGADRQVRQVADGDGHPGMREERTCTKKGFGQRLKAVCRYPAAAWS